MITSINQASTHKGKKTDRVEIDALLGLMYFRGIVGVNLYMTDRLFSNDSNIFLCNNVKKLFQISQRPRFLGQTTRHNTAVGNR